MSNQQTQIILGINNLGAKCPWILDWLKDKEDANRFSYGSSKKVILSCPYCGAERPMVVSNIARLNGHIQCKMCGDQISYPNKFGRAFLQQLPIENFQSEYKSEWSNGAIYDDYFEYENKKYLVEFDGEQHLESYQHKKNSLYEPVHTDDEKTFLAIQNGYTLIRIDCRISSLGWIKEQIEKSIFNDLFDLSNIDWIQCGTIASKSMLIQTCEFFNSHSNMTPCEIAEHLNISKSTVSNYLRRGTELGLCEYNNIIAESIRSNHVRNVNRNNSPYLICAYDENHNLIGEYLSQTHAAEELNKMFPNKKIKANAVGKVARGEFHRHKGLYFERRLK